MVSLGWRSLFNHLAYRFTWNMGWPVPFPLVNLYASYFCSSTVAYAQGIILILFYPHTSALSFTEVNSVIWYIIYSAHDYRHYYTVFSTIYLSGDPQVTQELRARSKIVRARELTSSSRAIDVFLRMSPSTVIFSRAVILRVTLRSPRLRGTTLSSGMLHASTCNIACTTTTTTVP